MQEAGETSCSARAEVTPTSDQLLYPILTTATQVARTFIKAWLQNRAVLRKTLHFPTTTTPQVGILLHARRAPADPQGAIIRWDVVASVSGLDHVPHEACVIWWTPAGMGYRQDLFLVAAHLPVLLAAMEEVMAHIADPFRGGQTCLALRSKRCGEVRA